MKKSVCPYCDQVMESGMYCKGCRRIVLRPVTWEVDYFLNERHPVSEENCQYHGDLHTGEMPRKTSAVRRPAAGTNQRKSTGTASSSQRKNTLSRMAKKQPERVTTGRMGQGIQKKQVKSPVSRLVLVLVIYVILMFGGTFITLLVNLKNFMPDFGGIFGSSSVPEYVATAEATAPEAEAMAADIELEDWERSDEEVIAAGVACNGYGHYPVVVAELQEALEAELVQKDYQEWSEDWFGYNQVYGESTWYETDCCYDCYDAEGGFTITLYSDTATGEVHGVSWYSGQQERFLDAADMVAEALKNTGIAPDMPTGRELYEEFLEDGKVENDKVVLRYGSEIVCYSSGNTEDPFYQMAIYAPGYLTTAD